MADEAGSYEKMTPPSNEVVVHPTRIEDAQEHRSRGRRGLFRLIRDAIIRDGLALLNDVSVDGFSMEILAKRLSVGAKSLYSDFRSRNALIISAADEIYSRFEYPAKGGVAGSSKSAIGCSRLNQKGD